MKTLSIEYPEAVLSTMNLNSDDFEEEARMALAAKLYEMGRLTSGQAAVVARVPRAVFLLKCSSYGTPSVSWDKEELNAEFGKG